MVLQYKTDILVVWIRLAFLSRLTYIWLVHLPSLQFISTYLISRTCILAIVVVFKIIPVVGILPVSYPNPPPPPCLTLTSNSDTAQLDGIPGVWLAYLGPRTLALSLFPVEAPHQDCLKYLLNSCLLACNLLLASQSICLQIPLCLESLSPPCTVFTCGPTLSRFSSNPCQGSFVLPSLPLSASTSKPL